MARPTEAPRTEAGRRLLDRLIKSRYFNDPDLVTWIKDIEAEARRDAVTDAAQDWMRRAAEKKVAEAAALPTSPDAVEALHEALDSLESRWAANQAYPSMKGWQNLAWDAIQTIRTLAGVPAGLDAAKEAVLAAARAVYESQQVSGSTLPPGHSGVGGQMMTDWVRADRLDDLLDAIDGLLRAERAAAYAEGEQE